MNSTSWPLQTSLRKRPENKFSSQSARRNILSKFSLCILSYNRASISSYLMKTFVEEKKRTSFSLFLGFPFLESNIAA